MAPPSRTAEFDILYGTGISKLGEVIDMGVQFGIIDKSGAWFSYDGNRIGQGRENAMKFIQSDPELYAEIEAKVREKAAQKANDHDDIEEDDDESLDIRLLDIDDN